MEASLGPVLGKGGRVGSVHRGSHPSSPSGPGGGASLRGGRGVLPLGATVSTMGSLESLFIDPSQLPDNGYGFVQLVFLLLVYGFILFHASNLISDGSELLLLVPSLAGVVGSCVLPVLGAVPDGCIVLFSALGENAQEELQVGIGALAGSTIMLLTVPWCLSIIGGRVALDVEGRPVYRRPAGRRASTGGDGDGGWQKLDASSAWSLTKAGVAVGRPVRVGGIIMGLTASAYLLIQVPAFILQRDDQNRIAHGEKPWALAGFLICFVTFLAYLWYNHKIAQSDVVKIDKINEIAAERIANGEVTLLGVIAPELEALIEAGPSDRLLPDLRAETLPSHIKSKIVALTKPFFYKYDTDRSGFIDERELTLVLQDLGDPLHSEEDMKALLSKYDTNIADGILDLHEFTELMVDATIQRFESATQGGAASSREQQRPRHASQVAASRQLSLQEMQRDSRENGLGGGSVAADGGEDDEDKEDEEEEEEEEVPEDLKHLSWEEQQRRILQRSLFMMGLGTLLVLLFSDPMVGVLSELGVRLNVGAFYISFVLSPLASNASELIASYQYAKKKTPKTMSIALATLTGAGCMNNTFTLGLFLLIIYIKGLVWEFSAETVAILVVEVVMVAYTFKSVYTVLDGLAILSLYPFSLLLVAALEKYTSWN